MALIDAFIVPERETRDAGLAAIEMRRLGRFVALAGPNGAGKSRILQRLETAVAARRASIPNLTQNLMNARNLESTISVNPGHESMDSWLRHLESAKMQIELATNRVVANVNGPLFSAVRFVPKRLDLRDPRNFPSREQVNGFAAAKNPGLDNYESTCLFYIYQLQTRWYHADHQHFAGTIEEKNQAISEYESFRQLLERLLGTRLSRDLNGDPVLFGKPIADANLSDGQKVILQLAVALHAQRVALSDTVFVLDEPENHLHPSAVVDLLERLHTEAGSSQIWVATHSIPLLAYVASLEPMSIWYVEDGRVANAGRYPEKVLHSLLGDDERIGQLQAFAGLPAQLAAINYSVQSLLAPSVVADGQGDAQVSQIQTVISGLRHGRRCSCWILERAKDGCSRELVPNCASPEATCRL